MYGCGRGYLDTLLEEAGAKLTVFHNEPNPLFGGHPSRTERRRHWPKSANSSAAAKRNSASA